MIWFSPYVKFSFIIKYSINNKEKRSLVFCLYAEETWLGYGSKAVGDRSDGDDNKSRRFFFWKYIQIK
jgi:hypothetical protein